MKLKQLINSFKETVETILFWSAILLIGGFLAVTCVHEEPVDMPKCECICK